MGGFVSPPVIDDDHGGFGLGCAGQNAIAPGFPWGRINRLEKPADAIFRLAQSHQIGTC